MKALLSFLWSGCWHRWVRDEKVRLTIESDLGGKSTGYRVYGHCEKCGIPKKWDLA